MSNPFCYYKTPPEVIRLAVMLYVRFPLSLRQVEDLHHFNLERHLYSRQMFKQNRSAALNECRQLAG